MTHKIFSKMKVLAKSISTASVDDAWPSRHQIAPCRQVKDLSSELMTLFTRRRELMYQVSILIAVGGALLQSIAVDGRVKHFGVSSHSILTLFLGVGSLIFCFRFIQLHLGVLYHGIQFALIEAKRIGEINPFESNSVIASSKINVRGVSFSVILFFSILSSLCFAVSSRDFLDYVLVPYLVFFLVFAVLMYRTFSGHAVVADSALADSHEFIESCDCSNDDDIRAHYQMSLAATHSDLICVSAIAAAQTISVYGFIGLVDERVASGLPISRFGPSIIGAISLFLGLLAVAIYSRLELAVQQFCSFLSLPTNRLFWSAMSDVGLGRFVTIAFAGMNCSFLVFLAFDLFRKDTLDMQIRDLVSIFFGFSLIICLLLLHSRRLRRVQSHSAQ